MDEPVGRAKGGIARAEKLPAERRQEIGRKGAQARKDLALLPKITHGSSDHPLKIYNTELPCYVLEGGVRVLSQRGVQGGIGMSTSGGVGGAHRLAQFIESLAEKGINCTDLAVRIRNPIVFRPSIGGKPAYGYEATMLPDICDAVLEARTKKLLHPQQEHFAKQCEILVRGFARVGIIALVDEATGYQRDRDRNNLAKILEAFVAKEIQPYVKTFPNEYYEELFRLYRIPYPPAGNKSWRPQFFGHITNEVVYARLAPSLIPELKKIASKAERKARLFQALTQEIGHPRLKEHLASIVAIQKLSETPDQFLANVNRVHRRYNQTLPLFDEKDTPIPPNSGISEASASEVSG
jgi:hypothetical protein